MTTEFWDHFVDTKTCGGYLMRCIIGTSDHSAVYLTRYGEEPASIKLTTETKTPDVAPHLQHPNLLQQLETGTCDRGNTRLRYYVTEHAEENLGSVVTSRALTIDEARGLLNPVVDALSYLHGRGLVHGRLKPSNILAKGDVLKLSTDSVRPASDAFGPADDLRDLGLTIVEVLTQRREGTAIPPLEQPFRDIVEHTLHPEAEERWTIQQVAMRLAGKLPAAKVPPAPRPAQPVEALATSPPSPEPPPSSAPQPMRGRRFPAWALPGAAIVMLLAVVFVLARGPAPTPSPSPAAHPPSQQQQPATANPQPLPPPKPAAFDPPKKQEPIPLPQPKAVAPPNGQGWFVVTASYAREADARLRAQFLAKRFPQFHFSVFPPSAIDIHYLVILGSGLSSQGAQSLRDRAVSSGLPHDTYIKKYPGR